MISLDRLKPVRLQEYYEDKDEMPEKIVNEKTKLVQPEIRKEEIKASVLRHKESHAKEPNEST